LGRFRVHATYGFVQTIAIGAEVTAVAIYFAFWFPHIPQWIWEVLVSITLITINTLQVGGFGEFECWFVLIKVVAILAFIAVRAGLIFGIGSRVPIGFSNLTSHGGFLPHGLAGVWFALTLVLTSYMGVEAIAVTASEAERPEQTIPNAMRTTVLSDLFLRPCHPRHAWHESVERSRRRRSLRTRLRNRWRALRRWNHERRGDHRPLSRAATPTSILPCECFSRFHVAVICLDGSALSIRKERPAVLSP